MAIHSFLRMIHGLKMRMTAVWKNQLRRQPLKTIVCIKIWFEVFLLGSQISLAKAIYYKLM